jgi:hypothetical protein
MSLGQGVPEDMVHAQIWLDLSRAHAARIVGAQKLAHDAQEMRNTLARKMTPAQNAKVLTYTGIELGRPVRGRRLSVDLSRPRRRSQFACGASSG